MHNFWAPFGDNFASTDGQLWDNFGTTLRLLGNDFILLSDHMVTSLWLLAELPPALWPAYGHYWFCSLHLNVPCASNLFFTSTSWSSGPAEKYEQVIGSKGPPAFLCFPIFSFLFKKTHFLSPQKCQKLLMPSSMLTKKSKNVFCNSCLVGFVCNIF